MKKIPCRYLGCSNVNSVFDKLIMSGWLHFSFLQKEVSVSLLDVKFEHVFCCIVKLLVISQRGGDSVPDCFSEETGCVSFKCSVILLNTQAFLLSNDFATGSG